MSQRTPRKESKGASRRDVYRVGGISILMSILAVAVGVGRTQQIADRQVRDTRRVAIERQADRDAAQRAQTAQLKYSLAVSDYRSCKRGNVKDNRLLDYVDGSVERGTLSLRATLASPTATVVQKQTALRNLAGAAIQRDQLHKALKAEVCGNAPIRPPSPH